MVDYLEVSPPTPGPHPTPDKSHIARSWVQGTGWTIDLWASCWPILFHVAAQGPCGWLGSVVASELVTSAWASSLRAEATVPFLVTLAHLGDDRLEMNQTNIAPIIKSKDN